MNNILLRSIITIAILTSFYTYGQNQKYYQNNKGDTFDENRYKQELEKELIKIKKSSPKASIYEDLEVEFERNDSIVYSYHWYETYDKEMTIAYITKIKSIIDKEFPIKEVKTLDGEIVSISDFKGKPTLINIWFTSCSPCIKEMPVLNTMKENYGDKFNFIALTFSSENKVKKFLKIHEFNFKHIANSKALTKKLGFTAFPVNLFLDKEGKVQKIKESIPYERNEKGELELSDGASFIKILESML